MNVLSLFDGMSCGQIALDRLGIKVVNYFASEIDKHAIAVAKKHYPKTQHIGDVKNVKGVDLPKIDLLIGGSPCQGFSSGGECRGFKDNRSKLFWEYVRVLNETRPRYFLLENVKMKQEWCDIITKVLNVEPVLINSNLLTAQNRQRLYWTNILNVTQPNDLGVYVRDILESPYEYYRIRASVQWNSGYTTDKCMTLVSAMGMGGGYIPMLISEEFYKAHKKKYINGDDRKGVRKLSIIECERLQGLPDNYTCSVSKTQRLKMIGNGWTVPVIVHIFKGLIPNANAERTGLSRDADCSE